MQDWQKVKRTVFARHSNPWSAWTRWASAPLMLVPVWRRSGRRDSQDLWIGVSRGVSVTS